MTHTHTPFFQELCSSGRGTSLLRAVLVPGVLARGIRSIFCCEVYRHACRKRLCMSALPISTHTYMYICLCTHRLQGPNIYMYILCVCGWYRALLYSITCKSNVVRHVSDLVHIGTLSSALTGHQ